MKVCTYHYDIILLIILLIAWITIYAINKRIKYNEYYDDNDIKNVTSVINIILMTDAIIKNGKESFEDIINTIIEDIVLHLKESDWSDKEYINIIRDELRKSLGNYIFDTSYNGGTTELEKILRGKLRKKIKNIDMAKDIADFILDNLEYDDVKIKAIVNKINNNTEEI